MVKLYSRVGKVLAMCVLSLISISFLNAQVADGSFEGGSPNSSWAEASTNFGSPLCNSGCSGGTNFASDGAWWAWFGGVNAFEDGSLTQSVTIPQGFNTLRFFIALPACGFDQDFFEITIDGAQVYNVTGASADCGTTTYIEETVDVSFFADGNPHTIVLRAVTNGQNPVDTSQTNIFVDNVSLVSATASDISLGTCAMSEYTSIPIGQETPFALTATVTNNSLGAVSNVTLQADVILAGSVVYTGSFTPVPSLGGGLSTTFVDNGAGFTPMNSLPGDVYATRFIVSMTEADANSLNDTCTSFVLLDDTLYARDEAILFGTVDGALGVGAGATAIMGNNYEFTSMANVPAVGFFVNASVLIGDSIQAHVYNVDANTGLPTTRVASTPLLVATPADTPVVYVELPFSSPLQLAPGMYYFGVEEFANVNNMGLFYNENVFTPGTCPANINGGPFDFIENLGFNVSFLVRPLVIDQSVVACPTPGNAMSTVNTSTRVTLSWDAVAGADHYEIQGNRVGAGGVATLSTPGTSRTVNGLNPGWTYWWQVKAWCDAAETDGSDWTVIDEFTMTVPCAAPAGLSTTNITGNSARLNWNGVAGVSSYEIRGRRVGTANWTNVPVGDPNRSFLNTGSILAGSTTYEWQIRSICNGAPSDWAALVQFSTSAAKAGEVSTTAGVSVELYPNPAQDNFTIGLLSFERTAIEINVIDVTGKVVFAQNVNSESTQQINVNTANWNDGVYQVLVKSNNNTQVSKVIIAR